MKPATNTLSEIFQAPIRLVVPIYQRPYVWERERHWQPLWEDILAVLERHLDGEQEHLRHFLGAVVLDYEDTPLGEAPRRLIIDGQQRLTTIQLLFAAAVRNAEDDGADQQARLLSKLIQNDPDLTTGDERFKVWPTNVDQAVFREVMASGETKASGAVGEAHQYFRGVMRDWLLDGAPDADELTRRHKALWVTLSGLLQVVSINLEPGDNAQVIFETLNARGTPLLAMDLVKNAVFYRAQREQVHVDRLNETVWEPELGREYWRDTVRQGRLNRPRAELFLMHWLAMKLGRIVPATELFAEFRAHVLGVPTAAPADLMIAELCRDAGVLRGFDDRPPGTVEEQFFRHLDALDTSTVIPVALLLYRSDEVTEDRRHVGLRALESWLVRRMLCGLTAQAYNRLMADLLKALRTNLEFADEVIVGFLRESSASSAVWPTDEMVSSFLTARYLYGYISQKRIVMMLSAIETDLRRDNKTEDIWALPTNLTVEHVMPQKWTEHWPLTADQDPDEREAHINRLGNLTLTSGPLNSSLSNAPWSQKRRAVTQHSLLLINQQLSEHAMWDEEAIDRRGESLALQMCRLWPGPEDSIWPATEVGVAAAGLDALPPAVGRAPLVDHEGASSVGGEPAGPMSNIARDGRDFSRFRIVVDGEELPAQNKRNSVRVMVTSLFGKGIPMVDLAEKLGSHLKSVEGCGEDFVSAFQERYPNFDPAWWYTDHPFHDGERTWLLDKKWGAQTESVLASLSAAFPHAGIGFHRLR
jgi:hypothetical protein